MKRLGLVLYILHFSKEHSSSRRSLPRPLPPRKSITKKIQNTRVRNLNKKNKYINTNHNIITNKSNYKKPPATAVTTTATTTVANTVLKRTAADFDFNNNKSTTTTTADTTIAAKRTPLDDNRSFRFAGCCSVHLEDSGATIRKEKRQPRPPRTAVETRTSTTTTTNLQEQYQRLADRCITSAIIYLFPSREEGLLYLRNQLLGV